MDSAEPVRVESAGTVDRSLPCIHCGYNLYTLATAGRCPECGMPVEMTVTLGGELQRTRPAYARRMALASRMLLYARVAAFTGAFLTLVQGYVPPTLIIIYCYIAASLACLAGSWLLTSREHPRLPPEHPWLVRLIRATTLLALLGFLPWMLIGALPHAGISGRLINWLYQHTTATEVMANLAMVLYGAYPAMEMRIMVSLARRVADDRLGKRAVLAGLGATIAAAYMALMGFVVSRLPGLDHPIIEIPLTILTMTAFCALLACWLLTAWNCWLASRAFSKAATAAEGRWLAAQAA